MLEGMMVPLISAMLINNAVLAQCLGICPLISASSSITVSIKLAITTTLILSIASVLNYLIQNYILSPLGISHLRILASGIVIVVLVASAEYGFSLASKSMHNYMHDFSPLILSNTILLSVLIINLEKNNSLITSLFSAIGSAAGFSIVLVLFAAMRENLMSLPVPAPFRGAAIGLISAGLASLGFMGLSGLV